MPMSVRRTALHGRRRQVAVLEAGRVGELGVPAGLLGRDGAYVALAA